MQIVVLSDQQSKEELLQKKISSEAELIFINSFAELKEYKNANAYFVLTDHDKEELKNLTSKPVFINSVIGTLRELDLPENFIRINGWATFLKRDIWEVAAKGEVLAKDIFNKLNWKYIAVADEPGLVAARVIAMIINEAYFALHDEISTKVEIDLAMKLGTNYPYGPFEWCRKIGIENIYQLLKKLSRNDSRYKISPALEKELN